LCLSDGNRKRPIRRKLDVYSQKAARSGCTGLSGSPGWRLSKDYSRVSTAAYDYKSPDCPVVHRTVSGELAAAKSPLSGTKSTAYGYNSPDCPVSQRSAGPTVGRVICARRVAEPMVRREHRTVRCAPDSVWCANGSESSTVGFAK
jgi:hypothetical protein